MWIKLKYVKFIKEGGGEVYKKRSFKAPCNYCRAETERRWKIKIPKLPGSRFLLPKEEEMVIKGKGSQK